MLSTSSLDEWLVDIKEIVPEVEETILTRKAPSSGAPAQPSNPAPTAPGKPALPPGRVAGRIETQLTTAQRELVNRKAAECVDVLAHLTPQNVILEEFPKFDMSRVPECREAAKQLLKQLGRQGAAVVVG